MNDKLVYNIYMSAFWNYFWKREGNFNLIIHSDAMSMYVGFPSTW